MAPPSRLHLVTSLVVLVGCPSSSSSGDGSEAGTSMSSSPASESNAAPDTGPGGVSDGAPATSDSPATSNGDATTDASASASATAGDETGGGQACVDDHRVIAYLANWDACPSAEQLAQYSHVVIAFAVSYTWTPDGVVCDPSCTISPVDGCTGTDLATLVGDLHAAGVEVLVSFGGASMGGIWEGTCGQMTKCWDACIDQAESVAAQLTDVVVAADLDGVDIDYEYCLHDEAHRGFLVDLTGELRADLDAASPGEHKLLTHVPMDSEVEAGDPYFDIVGQIAPQLDFLMVQYYNGGLSPFTTDGLAAIHDHYDALVSGPFAGDASKVLVGFCIEPGCDPVATQPAAADVMAMFDGWYPGAGGTFFWAHPDDTGGWFSQPLRALYDETVCAP